MPGTRLATIGALCACCVCASVRPAFGQCPDGTPPPCVHAAVRGPAANSVAVLYFDNTSRDTSDAYLADGLTEEIILRLQQVRRLEVKSRFESQHVRKLRGMTPQALGRALSARYLVNGTIQRAGERLVVRVELTRADRGVGVWSQRFDKTSTSVLDVIDDVARGVATGVAGELLPAEAADLARRPSTDPVAYEHYVRGNFYVAQRTPAGFARAVDEYEAAYAVDPGFTKAVSRIAYAWALGTAYGVGDLPEDTVHARAVRAIERAKREAPGLSDTWMAIGFLQFDETIERDADSLEAAVSSLARAVELDPGSAEAHHQYAQPLELSGRDSAALAEYERALALERGRAVTYQEIGFLFLLQGHLERAIAYSDSALAADPQHVRGYLVRGRARLLQGDDAAAEQDAARALAIARGSDAGDAHALQALILAFRGDTAGARREAASAGNGGYFVREWMVAIGEPGRALDQLERMRSRSIRCFLLRRTPDFSALRGQPRYERMLSACPPAPQQ